MEAMIRSAKFLGLISGDCAEAGTLPGTAFIIRSTAPGPNRTEISSPGGALGRQGTGGSFVLAGAKVGLTDKLVAGHGFETGGEGDAEQGARLGL